MTEVEPISQVRTSVGGSTDKLDPQSEDQDKPYTVTREVAERWKTDFKLPAKKPAAPQAESYELDFSHLKDGASGKPAHCIVVLRCSRMTVGC